MRKSITKYFLLALLLTSVNAVKAQDPHFTQYHSMPLYVNPALTGFYNGSIRASTNYRMQWTGIGDGYKTFGFSADAPLGKGQLGNGNFFGVGLLVAKDQAGMAGFNSTLIEGALSYVAALDRAKTNYFSVGFQAGLNQNGIDVNKATWDSQWNGDSFDPSLPSFEAIQLAQFTYLDLNAGVNYAYLPEEDENFNVGFAVSHIGSPNISFFQEGETPYRRKYTLHSSASIGLDRERTMWVQPKLIAYLQGNQSLIMAGGYFRNKLQLKSLYTGYLKEAFVYLGAFYRYQDAVAIATRFEFNTLGIGVSYDINTSSLSRLAGSANAFEFNLSYVSYIKRGEKKRKYNRAPRFF